MEEAAGRPVAGTREQAGTRGRERLIGLALVIISAAGDGSGGVFA
jgi:hypothetical protein